MLKKEKDSDRVLEGAVFALCNKEDIVNANGDVILKADTVIEEQATDKEGKLTFTADLPIGYTYYVKETSPAPGFATTDQVQEFPPRRFPTPGIASAPFSTVLLFTVSIAD